MQTPDKASLYGPEEASGRSREGISDAEDDAGKRERLSAAVGAAEVRCRRALRWVDMLVANRRVHGHGPTHLSCALDGSWTS